MKLPTRTASEIVGPEHAGTDEGMRIPFALPWSVFHADRRATTALEYALLTSLVGVIITMALGMAGRHLDHVLNTIASSL